MRKTLFVFLFIMLMGSKPYAQYHVDPSDTVFSRWGVMLYLSGSSAFPMGALDVPTTEFESEYPVVVSGQIFNTTRVKLASRPGFGYSAGLEFLCNSYCNAFTVIDVGIADYSYNVAVTDALYTVNYIPPATTTYGGTGTDNVIYSYKMFDISLYRFHNLLNTAKDKLSAGLGFKLGGIFSESNSDNNTDEIYESTWIVPFLSAALRYDVIEHKRSLISTSLYFNCGYVFSANGLASAGFQIGFNL